jgi:hypothetical protein
MVSEMLYRGINPFHQLPFHPASFFFFRPSTYSKKEKIKCCIVVI